MKKIANATMHNQGDFRGEFKKLGFDVEATPRLRPVSGAKDAYSLACEVVEQARKEGFDGLLIGGRTDIMIYIAIEAPIVGLDLFIAETVRERDENDRFVFNLAGVTKVFVEHPDSLVGSAIVAQVDTVGLRKS